MAAIDLSLVKFYASVATEGGDINLSALQVSSVISNEISQITNAERQTGTIRYVKQFMKNETGQTFGPAKAYIDQKTQYSANTSILFGLTGAKSKLYDSVQLSGVATVTATGPFATSEDLRLEIAPGDWIFNSTDDAASLAVEVIEVRADSVVVVAPYVGTLGSGKSMSVAPASLRMFTAPLSAGDQPYSTTLESGEYIGIWKQYVVYQGCPQFENDWFTIIFEEI